MYLLKVDDIAKVTKDVENEGINYSHLSTDLVDHICCEIESYMNHGISFSEAYDQVKMKFNIKGLRHIQQDTLMLIDKNYRIMKNSMKTIGVLSLALMAFGALFKIMHWPFSELMLTISFVFVTLVFFPALLYVMYRDVNQKQQAGIYVVAFFSGLVFSAGVLFKIMHWPYAQILLFPGLTLITYVLIPMIIVMRIRKLQINKAVFLTGLISIMIVLTGLILKINHWPGAAVFLDLGAALLVLLFIPWYYVLEVKKSEKLRLEFIFGIIALTYFIVFTFLLALSGNKNLLFDLNYQVKSYQANVLYINDINKELLKDTKHELAKQLVNKADLIDNEIEEIKLQIIQIQYKVTKEDAMVLAKENVYIDDNEGTVSFLLPQFNSNSPLPKLKGDIEDFNRIYSNLLNDSLKQNVPVNQIFKTEKRFIPRINQVVPWEGYCLMEYPPAAALNALSFWQYNIRLVENKALSELVSNSKNN